MKKYLRFCRGLNNVTIGIAIALLISAVTLTFVQVCTRNFRQLLVPLGRGIDALPDHLSAFSFHPAMCFTIDANAKVEVILNRFPPKSAKRVVLIIFLRFNRPVLHRDVLLQPIC